MAKSITPEQLAASGTEHGHQAALFCWAAQNFDEYPALRLMFAIPNGGHRHGATAARMVAEGVKAGVFDIFLPVPKWNISIMTEKPYCVSHGLFLEMKIKPNKLTENQYEFMNAIEAIGYKCEIAYSWIEAKDKILAYLNG